MTSDVLRSEYVQAVMGLKKRVAELRGAGMTAEGIARTVHADRRALAAHFKERTSEPLRSLIYSRTLAIYGDHLGPSVDYLRAQGKDWDAIIESAIKPGSLPAFRSAK